MTRGEDLSRRARLLRDPQSPTPLILRSRRTPAYLDPVQAACVRAQMGAQERILAHHRELAEVYRDGLARLPIALPRPQSPGAHSWYWFVIRTAERERLRRYLKDRGIENRGGF